MIRTCLVSVVLAVSLWAFGGVLASEILLEEDFEQTPSVGIWYLGMSDTASRWVEEGLYVIDIQNGSSCPWGFIGRADHRDVRIETRALISGDTSTVRFYVIFGRNASTYFAFGIRGDGSSSLWKVNDDGWKALKYWENCPAANPAGRWNSVTVDISGERIACYVNGTQAIYCEDASLDATGKVGLMLCPEDSKGKASIDYLRLSTLDAPLSGQCYYSLHIDSILTDNGGIGSDWEHYYSINGGMYHRFYPGASGVDVPPALVTGSKLVISIKTLERDSSDALSESDTGTVSFVLRCPPCANNSFSGSIPLTLTETKGRGSGKQAHWIHYIHAEVVGQ